jgi:glutathione-independent formaldehyde dehydrogenase
MSLTLRRHQRATQTSANNSLTLNDLVQSVRFTGGIGTVGVYVTEDPGGPDDLAKHGKARFDFGEFWFKGQAMGSGQCPVKRYNRYLRSLIHEGKVTPSWVVSHNLPLDQAPEAYKHFDAREEGWTKVVLHPNQTG